MGGVNLNNIMMMYHYIRDNSNFKSFTTEQFRNQLQSLKEKGYRFITVEELITKKPDDKTCCLTFDDGIKDGKTNIFPILQEFNAIGTFFIPMRIFVVKEILSVQKRHLLLSKLGNDDFMKKFSDFGPYDSIDDCKYIIDHIDQNIHSFVLDKIFKEYFNESDEFDKIYLNNKDIGTLMANGMEIGTHGFNHLYLGEEPYSKMKEEIQLSYGICENLFEKPFSMSYPMGSYSPIVKRMIESVGYKAGVTTIKQRNTVINPFELNRYDCIDVGIF